MLLGMDHGAGESSDAGGGKSGIEGCPIAGNLSLGTVGKSHDSVAGMAKVNGVGAVGCIKKIKLLQHRIFTRSGSLEGVDLGTGGEESDLTWSFELIHLSQLRGLLTRRATCKLGIHSEAEIAVFKFRFEA